MFKLLLIYLSITTQLITLPYRVVRAQAPFQAHFQQRAVPDQILDEEFAEWVEKTGYEWGIKGVAVAVTRRHKDENGCWAGWKTETKGYGVADRWGTPVSADTLFAIASNSKLFTAMGVGLLTENASLPITWETKIKDILPQDQWQLQDPVAQNKADLIDILTHRIGLPRHDLSYSRTDTLATVISKLRYLKPSAEFRDIFQYNNQMYALAAYIIQHVIGIPFSRFITENIISPLNVNATTYNVTEAQLSGHLADGFVSIEKDTTTGERRKQLVSKPVPFFLTERDVELNAGPGGVISSANDLVIWLQMLLLNGKHPITNSIVIPESVVHRTAQGVTFVGPSPTAPELSPVVYGLGQEAYSYQGHNLLEHSGSNIGHFSVITRAPDDGVGIAILLNAAGDSPFINLIKFRLLENTLGLRHIDWASRYSTAEKNDAGPAAASEQGESHAKEPMSLPIRDLAGVYFNPAYGTIQLCEFHAHLSSTKTSSTKCKETVDDISAILHGPPPTLVATWPKFWTTHLLLHHQDKNLFDASAILVFPAPFPDAPKSKNGSHPFSVQYGQGLTNFVLKKGRGTDSHRVDGIALIGAWGSGTGVKIPAGTDRESAEVWFDRVV